MARPTTRRRGNWFGGFSLTTMGAVAVWLRHANSRQELGRMNRRDLADVGLWRIDEERRR